MKILLGWSASIWKFSKLVGQRKKLINLSKLLYLICGLATLGFHAPNKILNNKINVNRHHLQGCNQVNTLENNDALIDIFQKKLQSYWTVSGVKYPPDFSKECQDYSQLQQVFNVLQNYKDYIWTMKNSILVKMAALLNKMKKDLNKWKTVLIL